MSMSVDGYVGFSQYSFPLYNLYVNFLLTDTSYVLIFHYFDII